MYLSKFIVILFLLIFLEFLILHQIKQYLIMFRCLSVVPIDCQHCRHYLVTFFRTCVPCYRRALVILHNVLSIDSNCRFQVNLILFLNTLIIIDDSLKFVFLVAVWEILGDIERLGILFRV